MPCALTCAHWRRCRCITLGSGYHSTDFCVYLIMIGPGLREVALICGLNPIVDFTSSTPACALDAVFKGWTKKHDAQVPRGLIESHNEEV